MTWLKRLNQHLPNEYTNLAAHFSGVLLKTVSDISMNLPERKLYGRHKGHRLSQRQTRLFEQLLPELKVDLEEKAPAQLEKLFSVPVSRFVLEIGFGGGEHLIWQAQRNSETGFIGCEPFVNGVAKALMQIEDENLQNIRLHNDDARFVLDWLPENSLDMIYILFPDPWPKKRHHKRRFISAETLDQLSRPLKSGGIVHVASDIGDYVRATLVAFQYHNDFKWLDNKVSDWRIRPENRPVTRYEQKALDAGRVPSYLTFSRK